MTAKASRKQSEQSHRAYRAAWDFVLLGERGESRHVERVGLGVEPEDADEQQRGRNEGVDEILDGGGAAVLGAPEGGDEDGHRNQRKLPERVVEEQVERDEDTEHRDLLEQEQGVEGLLAVGYLVPAGEDAEGREEAGKHDQPHAQAIDAEMVADGGGGDPGEVLGKAEGAVNSGSGVVERKMERGHESEEGDDEGDGGLELAAVGQKSEEDGAGERDEEDEGEDVCVDVHEGLEYCLVREQATATADPLRG